MPKSLLIVIFELLRELSFTQIKHIGIIGSLFKTQSLIIEY